MADQLDKNAAKALGHAPWVAAEGPFGDPVELVDASRLWVRLVPPALAQCWWAMRRATRPRGRRWLDLIFTTDLQID